METENQVELERTVLASCLLSDNAVLDVTAALVPEDLYASRHREILASVIHLAAMGRPVDVVSVCDDLTSRGTMEIVGGPHEVTALVDHASYTDTKYLTARLKDRSRLRKIANIGMDISARAMLEDADPGVLATELQESVFDLSASTSGPERVGDILPRVFDHIEAAARGEKRGIPTGLSAVDAIINGFGEGDLAVLAGRPGMGKTAFALHIAANAAKIGKNVYVASYEMSRESIVLRRLCSEAGVSMHQVSEGTLPARDMENLSSAATPVYESKIWIDDRATMRVGELYAEARRQKARHGCDLIIVDYIQLIPSTKEKGKTRETEVSAISRGLKIMARMLRTPVLALAQLNRGVETRSDKRPMLSDLRESGAIEQDADVVMLLYRDDYYDRDTADKDITEVDIAKQRNGPTGRCRVYSPKKTMEYQNLCRIV